MGINKLNVYSRQTDNNENARKSEIQRAQTRQNFAVYEKPLVESKKQTRDLLDEGSRQQTFEELKTIVRAVQTGETIRLS